MLVVSHAVCFWHVLPLCGHFAAVYQLPLLYFLDSLDYRSIALSLGKGRGGEGREEVGVLRKSVLKRGT